MICNIIIHYLKHAVVVVDTFGNAPLFQIHFIVDLHTEDVPQTLPSALMTFDTDPSSSCRSCWASLLTQMRSSAPSLCSSAASIWELTNPELVGLSDDCSSKLPCSTSTAWSEKSLAVDLVAGRSETRQRGQVVLVASQWSMQSTWNVCPHGGILWRRSSDW